MDDNLDKKVKDWLMKHGYPFELFVASVFQKEGFYVSQSLYYLDPDLNQSREIDVVASLVKQIGDYSITVSFIVECKSSKSKPWVGFTANDNTQDIYQYSRISATPLSAYVIDKLIDTKKYLNTFFQNISNTYSYAVAQSLKDGDNYDVPFKAIQTVIKAIGYFAQRDNIQPNRIFFYIPLIAIEAPLFECYLKIDGDIEVKAVTETTYLSRSGMNNNPLLIEIVTKDSIHKYAENQFKLINDFMFRYGNEIEKILLSRK